MKRLNFSLNLMTRVILLVSVGLLWMFAGFIFLSLQTVQESTTRTLNERLLIAQLSANRVDDHLKNKIRLIQIMIDDGTIDLSPDPSASSQALKALSHYLGDFVNYVALLDNKGNVIWTEPYLPNLVGYDVSSNRFVAEVLKSGRTVVSGYFSPGDVDASAALMVPTKKDDGVGSGVVLAAVNLHHPSISQLLGPTGLGQKGYAEIIDEEGFPLASTSEEQSWRNCRYGDRFFDLIRSKGNVVGQCHDCHTTSATARRQNGVMAFAALSAAPWGVVVQQDEAEAFAYDRDLQQKLVTFGGAAFLLTLVVAWLLTRSVVNPIQTLTAACQQISAGNLSKPIPRLGGAEVGVLASSFEGMRQKLNKSLEEIQRWNQELEGRVSQRTKELEEAEGLLRELSRKLVVAQEEERKALARELHDETSQALTALVVNLETITTGTPNNVQEIKSKLESTKLLATEMLREVQRIILDLRPAILDDLGLVQAIDWYAETRLTAKGVRVTTETVGVEKRLSAEAEIVVFRIAQEAINNVARHAKAENVNVSLDFQDKHIVLEVEDDGIGFAPEKIMQKRNGTYKSFGLIGMRERVQLFGGNLQIESQIGEGTRFVATIPSNGVRGNGKGSHSVS